MKINLLDLQREYNYLKNDIQGEISVCLKDQKLILGPQVSEFEKKSAEYLGTKYSAGVASGTDAMLLSLHALALEHKGKEFFDKKNEIITTPLTFLATAEAIIRAGARPVFVDIDPNTYNIDPSEIQRAVNKNTVGILPVHLYGAGCDMKPIKRIAQKNKLFVLEDACQAFGAEYRGKKLGALGNAGCFSFFPSKNLGGWGDGGLVVTNNKKIDNLIRILRNHGQKSPYKAEFLGINSRLDSLQAAVLLAKLKHIDKFNKKRIEIARQYNKSFSDITDLDLPLTFNLEPLSFQHIYHLYTIRVKKGRNKLLKHLNSKGIGARIYYPVSLNKMNAFSHAKLKGSLSNTEKACKQVLSLPIHPFMRDEEVKYVIDTVKSFYKS